MNLIEEGFNKFKDNKFIVVPGVDDNGLTYGQINEYAANIAVRLHKEGIKEKERVCVFIGNRIEHVIVYFALLKLKAIPVSMNIRRNSKEIGKIVEHCNPTKIIIMPMLFKKFLKVLDHTKVILMPEYEFIKKMDYEEKEAFIHYPDRTDDDLLMIAYTSGTTGVPKGVMTKCNGWLEASKNYAKHLRLDEKKVVYQALPIWQGGAIITFTLSVLTGATIVLVDMLTNSRFFEDYWDNIEKYKCNYLYTFPGIMSSLLLEAEKTPRSSYPKVYYAKVSSAVLLPEVRKKFEEIFGLKIIENYGSTEGNAIAITNPDEPYCGSVGKIIGSCPLKVSETGELLIKNQKWFAGYLFNEELTHDAYVDGWFKMVDIVKIKDDQIYLLGRVDAIINKEGETISPFKINNAIVKCENVFEVYTLGFNNSEYEGVKRNDEIYAVVSLKKKGLSSLEIEEEKKVIYEQCKESLPIHHLPKEIIVVDEIPKTASDKISRKDIIQIVKDYLKK